MQRLAYNFAIDVFGSGIFNTTHQKWYESMQRSCRFGNIYRATEEHFSLLEMPEIANKIRDKIRKLTDIFEGTKYGQSNDALNYVIDPVQISLQQFLDVAYIVQTRCVQIGSKQALIPLFDYVNNAESIETADLEFFQSSTHVGFITRKLDRKSVV